VRLGKEREMDIGKIVREIEVLRDGEEPIHLPEDESSIPEPTAPPPLPSRVPA
jgi:hypothetical protein